MELLFGLRSRLRVREGDKAKTSGSTRLAVGNHLGLGNLTTLIKVGLEGLVSRRPCETANKQLRAHRSLSYEISNIIKPSSLMRG